MAVFVSFVDFELPVWRNTISYRSLKLLRVTLLFFILFHGKDVVQEPLEDDGIAVNGDVDLVVVRYFLETSVEVFHIFDQKAARESKVALLVFAVVNNVDHNTIFKLEVLSLKHFEPPITMVEWCQSPWTARDLIGLGHVVYFLRIILCVATYSRI